MSAIEWVCRRVWPRRGRHAAESPAGPVLHPVAAPPVITDDADTTFFPRINAHPYARQETNR